VCFKNFVVDVAGELSFDDVCEYFSVVFEFSFDGDAGEYFFVETVYFTHFEGEGVGDLFLVFFDEFVDEFSHGFVVSFDLEQL
jgi:hypothetical protein